MITRELIVVAEKYMLRVIVLKEKQNCEIRVSTKARGEMCSNSQKGSGPLEESVKEEENEEKMSEYQDELQLWYLYAESPESLGGWFPVARHKES